MKAVSGLFFALLLTACAAQPKLRYSALSPNIDGWLIFTLPRSQIIVAPDDGADKTRPSIKSVPMDDYHGADENSFMISAKSGGAVSTSITKFEKIDNTRIVKSITFAATDNRAKLIDIASGVLTLVSAGTPGPTEPGDFAYEIIDPFGADGIAVDAQNRPMKNNPGWTYELSFGDFTKDTVATSTFRESVMSVSASELFAYSSCRDLNVTLKKGDAVYASHVKVADPTRVQVIALPIGQIAMHSQCGYDITNDQSSGNINTEAISKLVELAKSIKDKDKAKN